jgi:hypothetical protein
LQPNSQPAANPVMSEPGTGGGSSRTGGMATRPGRRYEAFQLPTPSWFFCGRRLRMSFRRISFPFPINRDGLVPGQFLHRYSGRRLQIWSAAGSGMPI